MEFERTSRRQTGNLPLTPMIDVMFILIIFFMLTTSFMRIESLELLLPSASGKAVAHQEVQHLFLEAGGGMLLGDRRINEAELGDALADMFSKNAGTKIMLLTADGVTMQEMVSAMDRVYMAGGRSLFVRKWDRPQAVQPQPQAGQ